MRSSVGLQLGAIVVLVMLHKITPQQLAHFVNGRFDRPAEPVDDNTKDEVLLVCRALEIQLSYSPQAAMVREIVEPLKEKILDGKILDVDLENFASARRRANEGSRGFFSKQGQPAT